MLFRSNDRAALLLGVGAARRTVRPRTAQIHRHISAWREALGHGETGIQPLLVFHEQFRALRHGLAAAVGDRHQVDRLITLTVRTFFVRFGV